MAAHSQDMILWVSLLLSLFLSTTRAQTTIIPLSPSAPGIVTQFGGPQARTSFLLMYGSARRTVSEARRKKCALKLPAPATDCSLGRVLLLHRTIKILKSRQGPFLTAGWCCASHVLFFDDTRRKATTRPLSLLHILPGNCVVLAQLRLWSTQPQVHANK
jgi:hypothetical protein